MLYGVSLLQVAMLVNTESASKAKTKSADDVLFPKHVTLGQIEFDANEVAGTSLAPLASNRVKIVVEEGSVVLRITGLADSSFAAMQADLFDSLLVKKKIKRVFDNASRRGELHHQPWPSSFAFMAATRVSKQQNPAVDFRFVPSNVGRVRGYMLARALLRFVRAATRSTELMVWFAEPGHSHFDFFDDDDEERYSPGVKQIYCDFLCQTAMFDAKHVFTGTDIDGSKVVHSADDSDVLGRVTSSPKSGFLITSDKIDVAAAALFVCDFLHRAERLRAAYPKLPVAGFKRLSFPADAGVGKDKAVCLSVVAIEAECFSLENHDEVVRFVQLLRDCKNVEVIITEASCCSRESMLLIIDAISSHEHLHTLLVDDSHVDMHKLAVSEAVALTSDLSDKIDFARSICTACLTRDPVA